MNTWQIQREHMNEIMKSMWKYIKLNFMGGIDLLKKIHWNGNVKFNKSNEIFVGSLTEWIRKKRGCQRLNTKWKKWNVQTIMKIIRYKQNVRFEDTIKRSNIWITGRLRMMCLKLWKTKYTNISYYIQQNYLQQLRN